MGSGLNLTELFESKDSEGLPTRETSKPAPFTWGQDIPGSKPSATTKTKCEPLCCLESSYLRWLQALFPSALP